MSSHLFNFTILQLSINIEHLKDLVIVFKSFSRHDARYQSFIVIFHLYIHVSINGEIIPSQKKRKKHQALFAETSIIQYTT